MLLIRVSVLWFLFVGGEGLSPFVFVSWPGGKKPRDVGMRDIRYISFLPPLGIARGVRSAVWTVLPSGE